MKTLIFSDIHASKNSCRELEALLPSYDRVLCCGDVVGYGQDPEYCIDFIVNNKIHTVKGNHDAMVTGECPVADHPVIKESITWTKNKLSERYKDQLRSLPDDLNLGDVYLTHTLAARYIYSREDVDAQIEKILKKTKPLHVAIGHSHVSFCFKIAGKTLVNPSSITKGRRGHARGYMNFDGEHFEFISLGEAAV